MKTMLFALMMSVCFSGWASANYADAPGAGEVQYLPGQYIVPAPTELSRYASFDIKYSISTDVDGKLIINYCLPEDIVGPGVPSIHLKEMKQSDSGLFEFEGTWGRGSCRKTKKSITCFVIYPGLPIDKVKLEALIRQKYAGVSPPNAGDNDSAIQSELEGRLALAELFSADPKGIVNLTRP